MPFAVTAASSRFMVSRGAWLLLTVIKPCAAMLALLRHQAAFAIVLVRYRFANAVF
jgi:hypothetical protein